MIVDDANVAKVARTGWAGRVLRVVVSTGICCGATADLRPVAGQSFDGANPDILDRLVSLADLYAAVYYFHPDVATSDSARAAWDEATALTIEAVASDTAESFRTLVDRLLRTLGDEETGLAGSTRAQGRLLPQQVLQYTGYPADVQNFYRGSYQPFVREWRLREQPSGTLHHEIGLADGVRAQVRYSRTPPDGDQASFPAAAASAHDSTASMYPRAGLRVIAAYRARAVIRYFYPYTDILHEDWTDVLRRTIPPLFQAGDSVAYALAVTDVVRHFHDSHVSLSGGAWDTFADVAKAPIGVRIIGDEVVVTGFVSDSVRRVTDLTTGDVVLTVNGRPIEDERLRLARRTSASTPQGLNDAIALQLLTPSPESDRVHIRVQAASGSVRDVAVAPTSRWWLAFRERRGETVYRKLTPDIGYIDLTRLRVQQVDSAFAELQDTRALIMDMRGYPQGTAWTIAPRLSTRDSLVVGVSWTRIASSPDASAGASVTDTAYVPYDAGADRYNGVTVLLIDERTASQAEYTAMMFRAANGTVLIGTPTMGANGDVTDFAIPGNLRVSFTGNGSRFADGTQLQRRGIQPDIYVAPSLSGVRVGRDEVLEHALKFLQEALPIRVEGAG